AGVWIVAARPKTLWAAVAPVVLGTALAVDSGAFHWLSATCALLAAVLIQIGTNYSNDYHDFVKGADTSSRKGPLRVTQAGLVDPRSVRSAATIAFALAFAAGLYLVWRGGWPILVVGLLSILFGMLYTAGRYSLSYLGVADLFVLVFFGPVAVAGTYYVQALELPWHVVVAGLGPGLLSTAILLVNNTRDIDEDRAAGKRTIVVRMGRDFGVMLYGAVAAAAALVPIVLAASLGDHYGSVAASGAVAVMAPGIIRKLRIGREGPELNPLLGATSRLLLIYSVLFGAGWLL
ncbi:MAG: 1,4-dihydroxy-2-naphthoate polyprenyltransferase, partial [Rhodothermales bacterium]